MDRDTLIEWIMRRGDLPRRPTFRGQVMRVAAVLPTGGIDRILRDLRGRKVVVIEPGDPVVCALLDTHELLDIPSACLEGWMDDAILEDGKVPRIASVADNHIPVSLFSYPGM